jgi:hypothetical protein
VATLAADVAKKTEVDRMVERRSWRVTGPSTSWSTARAPPADPGPRQAEADWEYMIE